MAGVVIVEPTPESHRVFASEVREFIDHTFDKETIVRVAHSSPVPQGCVQIDAQ